MLVLVLIEETVSGGLYGSIGLGAVDQTSAARRVVLPSLWGGVQRDSDSLPLRSIIFILVA